MLATKPETPTVARGHARLQVELVHGQSAVTSAVASNPVKILVPKTCGPSVWAYASNFGGGMVRGDQTRFDVQLGAATRCFFSTQASTKIYRNPSRLPCSHITRAELEAESLLVWAPDPVQAFAGSSYSQRQEFHLATGAGLVLLDWFNSGRAARGERWQFSEFKSRNDVFIDGERVFLDSILLDSSSGPLDSPARTGRFNCFATLLLIGEPLASAGQQILEKIADLGIAKNAPLIVSASPLRHGVVLRVAAEQVEDAGREIHRHLAFLPELLGDDPWERKW
jgi:urease accessory protein